MSYTAIVSSDITNVPHVEVIGYLIDNATSTSGPGPRKSLRSGYTIHFVTKGKGYFNGNPVTQGQGFLMYDGMISQHVADKTDPWELLWITLHGDNAKDLFDEYDTDPNTGIFHYTSPQLIWEIATQICHCSPLELPSTKLLEIFLRLHNDCIRKVKSKKQKTSGQSYTDWAVKYITSNLYRNVTVAELTSRIGVSQPYLYKLFKEHFHMSPKQYILTKKIEYAKKLLTDTNVSITEIANSIGYPDVLAFSKIFLLKEKVSPQKYRNMR